MSRIPGLPRLGEGPHYHLVDHLDWSESGRLAIHTYMLGFSGDRLDVSSDRVNPEAPENAVMLVGDLASMAAIRSADLVTHGPMRKLNLYLAKDGRWDAARPIVERELAGFMSEFNPFADGIAVAEHGQVVRRILAADYQADPEA